MQDRSAENNALPQIGEDAEGRLAGIRAFALDMDGTVYLGERWIEGAREWLLAAERSGRSCFFLTNNSSKSPADYVNKLDRMGLSVPEDRIITSGQATIWYIGEHYSGKRVFLLGNERLREEFIQAGISLDEENPELVVTGFDTTLTYEKLRKVCDFVRAGLPYLATHPDFNCPTEDGFMPDIGAIQAFIRASAFRDPDHIIGKPNRDISDYLLRRIGAVRPELADVHRRAVAMVGDRLYTDVTAGIRGGLTSILVLSGEARAEDAAASPERPDLIYPALRDIPLPISSR
ncbi:HAD-IIA family hydrolase [Lachnoclostridium sp. Marseille-P6806]|uniref:HAD-IIA family hydrolase n=1 Tax=Lachnoclostridium sp. Marseille-P6806 TaxID=2364793 RepID=UPI00102F414D|nr:HAD-IIA family hydrolase [Lachnoclostridium sp. Marseille-P6806]